MSTENDRPSVVVVRDHPGGAVVAAPGMRIDQLPSTLPRDADGIKRRFNAMSASTLDMDRDGTVCVELADVLAWWREGENEETGEVREFSWLVLIDTSGQTFGTSSPVVAEKVGKLLALRSAGLIQWPCPIQVVTRTAVKTRQRYHDVVMI